MEAVPCREAVLCSCKEANRLSCVERLVFYMEAVLCREAVLYYAVLIQWRLSSVERLFSIVLMLL